MLVVGGVVVVLVVVVEVGELVVVGLAVVVLDEVGLEDVELRRGGRCRVRPALPAGKRSQGARALIEVGLEGGVHGRREVGDGTVEVRHCAFRGVAVTGVDCG